MKIITPRDTVFMQRRPGKRGWVLFGLTPYAANPRHVSYFSIATVGSVVTGRITSCARVACVVLPFAGVCYCRPAQYFDRRVRRTRRIR